MAFLTTGVMAQKVLEASKILEKKYNINDVWRSSIRN